MTQQARDTGFQISEDLHGAVEEGFAKGEVTIDPRGRRASTARAYLHPVMDRSNLRVETGASTNRILISNGRAVGVEYVRDGQVRSGCGAGCGRGPAATSIRSDRAAGG
jgi:choline dehydrogenase